MTVESWFMQTAACTLAFNDCPQGIKLRAAAAAANPSWHHLTDYGRTVWLCQFYNPRKAA